MQQPFGLPVSVCPASRDTTGTVRDTRCGHGLSGFGRGLNLGLDGTRRGGRRRLPSRPLFPLGQQRRQLISVSAQFLQQVVRRWRISLHPHATIRPQAKAKASALGTGEDGGGGA
jgi:hypothetical protein